MLKKWYQLLYNSEFVVLLHSILKIRANIVHKMAYMQQHSTCKTESLFRSLCIDTIRKSRSCLCMVE